MAKTVAVVLESSEVDPHRLSEGLRMSVGLVLGKHDVYVLLFDKAVLASLKEKPVFFEKYEMAKHINALIMLKRKVWVNRHSLSDLHPEAEKLKGVELKKQSEMLDVIASADVVIRYEVDAK
ncbi:sulfur relay (sulfurtransferase) DsrF/TusC family protein [Bacillus pakistanensis]|uniref:Sulfur relay (Sulfurtransferase) DsrF/TusC family protein n=1 Tax=Rossellomorea pakistanensis TaxID=992288 RepID=A0ABS2N6P8_9BACI|nr:DsrE family protein [Bacillus pakistanensis]MBM7583536.1 sulfur relay (sulfurtransferase) DsrF/TusC family protein [Bacillus pakistanensis]